MIGVGGNWSNWGKFFCLELLFSFSWIYNHNWIKIYLNLFNKISCMINDLRIYFFTHIQCDICWLISSGIHSFIAWCARGNSMNAQLTSECWIRGIIEYFSQNQNWWRWCLSFNYKLWKYVCVNLIINVFESQFSEVSLITLCSKVWESLIDSFYVKVRYQMCPCIMLIGEKHLSMIIIPVVIYRIIQSVCGTWCTHTHTA